MEKFEDLIVEDNDELALLVEEYKKAKGDDFFVFPLKDRVKLFLAFVKDCDYKKSAFSQVEDFKNMFFDKEELEKIKVSNINTHLLTFVIGDKFSKENKLVVLFNKNGIQESENITTSNTCAFEVSFKDHVAKQTSIKDIKTNINNGTYKICDCKLNNGLNLENKEQTTIAPKNLSEDKVDLKNQEQLDNNDLNFAFEKYLSTTNSRQA